MSDKPVELTPAQLAKINPSTGRHSFLVEGARRAASMARLAEYEMKIIMGIVGATSGAGFAAVAGTGILEFAVKNKDNFDKWGKALSVCLASRAILKRHAPTLYDKLIDAVLVASGAVLGESLRNSSEAAIKDRRSLADWSALY